jgi:hypothetical protein
LGNYSIAEPDAAENGNAITIRIARLDGFAPRYILATLARYHEHVETFRALAGGNN